MADVTDAFRSLIAACTQLSLLTALYREPPRLRVTAPDAHSDLAEVVHCRANAAGQLAFWFSWGEEIGPADEPDKAADRLRRVVTVD
jgi:hypothetical protein